MGRQHLSEEVIHGLSSPQKAHVATGERMNWNQVKWGDFQSLPHEG
jgi:hypothetical protein